MAWIHLSQANCKSFLLFNYRNVLVMLFGVVQVMARSPGFVRPKSRVQILPLPALTSSWFQEVALITLYLSFLSWKVRAIISMLRDYYTNWENAIMLSLVSDTWSILSKCGLFINTIISEAEKLNSLDRALNLRFCRKFTESSSSNTHMHTRTHWKYFPQCSAVLGTSQIHFRGPCWCKHNPTAKNPQENQNVLDMGGIYVS